MSKRNCLQDILNRHSKTIIGLNSGTSADGIDASVVRISDCGYSSKVKFIEGSTYKFSSALKSKILKCAEDEFKDGVKWLEFDIELAKKFSEAVSKITKKAGLKLSDIDLIGSHGQTIRHLPGKPGKTITHQLADPSRIAVATGKTTVGDFRIADTAAGGQGAPLTPIVNAILFGRKDKTIGVLNIGGIANISQIKYAGGKPQLFGCDTGPGNMVVDYLMQKLYGKPYDKSGIIARRGTADQALAESILRSAYFLRKGPKSTGREQFGKRFAESLLAKARKRGLGKADIIATASQLTATAIMRCIKLNKLSFDIMILTGGGAKNRFFVDKLTENLVNTEIKHASDYGYPDDYLEAISFAVLANETICGNRYDLKRVTGARRETIAGKICPA